jgi:hypothetical protein
LPLTTGCSTLLKKKLSMLENRIERARRKLQRMERDHEATKIVKTNQTTWTPKKTLSQRLTNPTLLQRMTSQCTKSNEDLNSTSPTFQTHLSSEGRRNSLYHYERPTLYSRIGLTTPSESSESGLSLHSSQSSLSQSCQLRHCFLRMVLR